MHRFNYGFRNKNLNAKIISLFYFYIIIKIFWCEKYFTSIVLAMDTIPSEGGPRGGQSPEGDLTSGEGGQPRMGTELNSLLFFLIKNSYIFILILDKNSI